MAACKVVFGQGFFAIVFKPSERFGKSTFATRLSRELFGEIVYLISDLFKHENSFREL